MAEADANGDRLENPEVHYERRDVRMSVVVVAGISVIVLVVGVPIGLRWVFNYLDRRELASKQSTLPLAVEERQRRGQALGAERGPDNLGSQPLLDGLPPNDPAHAIGPWRPGSAQTQAAAEHSRLDSYGWVDEKKGIVRVPLRRAQELALKRKSEYLPARAGPKDDKTEPKP